MKNLLVTLHKDEDGATATEYIILLILIACLVIGIVKLFGENIMNKFNDANDDIEANVNFAGRIGV